MLELLSLLFNSLPYAAALLLGITLPALGAWCFVSFISGAAIIVGLFVIEALYMGLGGITLGVSLYATDLVLAFIGCVAMVRTLFAPDSPRPHWAWLAYLVLFALSLGAGLAAHGTTAGVQARGYFYSVAVAAYAMSFPLEQRHLRSLANLLCAAAVVMIALCAYRWMVYYTPITDLLPEGGTYNVDGAIRVIRSHEALLVSQALVLGLFFSRWSWGALAARIALPLLLACTVVLQHRSVWVAALAGIGASLGFTRGRAASRLSQVLLLLVMGSLTIIALKGSGGDVSAQLERSANTALQGQGTAGERLEGWQAMVGNWAGAGARSIAIGQPFGTPNARFVHDQTNGGLRKIDYIAHNHYVQTLYNLGALGAIAFVALLAHVLRALRKASAERHEDEALDAQALLVLLVMQAVYYIPYGTDYLQHLILGAALGYVAHQACGTSAAPAATRNRLRWRWA